MHNKLTNNSFKDFGVIDLFCGVGGLTHGFVKEQFNVVAGIDFDKSCDYAYEANNDAKFIHEDITKLTPGQLNELYGKFRKKILVGCAPCQPFSIYNSKKNATPPKESADEKWSLLYSFSNLIDATEPDIISMENVPLLAKFNNGKVFNDFLKRLENKGYYVSWQIVNAQDYGVPQRRKRLILLGSKLGPISLIRKTIDDKNYRTVRDAISDLPPVEDGVAHESDALHKARKLTPLNKRRIQAMEEGGFWRDWSDDLKLNCHKTENGKLFGSVYGRMKWDDVSPTMTTYCIGINNGRFGHPEQDRGITLREAALLQSFPANYKFINPDKPFNSGSIARQIGNAVPVDLGQAIAKSIKIHIEQFGQN
ncbi:DNA cytosine methyltransferase [Mucilaginibacter galii]|uniref:Cytosine-specific methyltransferase n=1 Tax=Mucilaginibacter galii TaxID=2005073 RepID=A0A917N2Z1_9SPHI|nr:DNA (cytosine-5-)-methyltransferase [Mucilaginibacter galii]GGI52398.1 cytosine-specific methyltransferase [Mucilaginibacter galii]